MLFLLRDIDLYEYLFPVVNITNYFCICVDLAFLFIFYFPLPSISLLLDSLRNVREATCAFLIN